MKERPILFSAPMVRAILEGRKTVTRRVVKPQPVGDPDICVPFAFPYGRPGDRLWVRETWLQFASRPEPDSGMPANACIDYRVDMKPGQEDAGIDADGDPYPAMKWRPSIFMPRWASRILLEITAVRIEHVKDISEEGAKAEGVTRLALSEALNIPGTWRGAFADLWDSINAKRGYCWDSNPWVWVIEFRRIAA